MPNLSALPEPVRRAEEAGQAAAAVADHWTEAYGIYLADDDHVVLTATLRTFLTGCHATNRHGIVMTRPHATLGPFVVQVLRDHGGHWVLYGHDGGAVLDARTGATLTSYEELWWHERPPLVGAASGSTPVLAFEIHAEHRAEERTRIGGLVADALPLLGGSEPRLWGPEEPLDRSFSLATITVRARAQMPDSDPIYVSDAVGSYAEITVSRHATGLRERLRGGVQQGPGATASATEALSALARTRHRVTVAALSELLIDPGPRWRRGPHHPERMVAAYLGPAALGRSGLNPTTIAARHDGTVVGRAQLPGVVVGFTGTPEERFTTYRALLEDLADGGADVRLEA